MPLPLADALATEVVTLDGGLATQLEARGHDLSDSLWSARLLIDDPAEIVAAHRDFVDAGARVVITASYQVSFTGFAAAGVDATETRAALRRSVALARAAIDVGDGIPRWVAASVGPYAASLGDGSEYRADHGLSVAELRAWHRPRLDVLVDAEPDLLAAETIAGLAEVEVLLSEVGGRGIPAWLSVTCEAGRLRSGEDAAQAWRMAREVPEIVAVGVNCTDPREVADLVAVAREAAGKPVVAYPNSGEVWDGRARRWTGMADFTPDAAASWVAAGARLVGGCCRVTADQIAAIA